jgi:hypothetical protein
MPVISRFFGILIIIYWRDHSPPHFHAKYGSEEVEIEVRNGAVLGKMNPRALGLVQEWRERHIAELLENWNLASQNRPLTDIPPLE